MLELSDLLSRYIKEELSLMKEELKNEIQLLIKEQAPDYLTAKEVCELYKISIRTLDRKIAQGLRPVNKSLTKTKRIFKRSDCDNFFKSRNHGR